MNRRTFLQTSGAALATACLPRLGAAEEPSRPKVSASFFLVGDTHLLADETDPFLMDEDSLACNRGLIDTLNRLPGTELPAGVGGGRLPAVAGLLHAGDLVDTGDKSGPVNLEMQRTEWASYLDIYGLNGTEGRLKMPVMEIAGNHDSPGGTGYIAEKLAARHRTRKNLTRLSANGLHYSWNWGGVHFIALGLIVGTDKTVARKRRYGAMDSLDFLREDLAAHPDKDQPVIIMHHVDVARYTEEKEGADYTKWEWDPADVKAFHAALAGRKVATFCGHTHSRSVLRWDGKTAKGKTGVPVFNVDNSAHFSGPAQAFFHVEVDANGVIVREYATKDAWATGFWTPQTWRADW